MPTKKKHTKQKANYLLDKDTPKRITKIIGCTGNRYSSVSHYIRIAIEEKLAQDEKQLKVDGYLPS